MCLQGGTLQLDLGGLAFSIDTIHCGVGSIDVGILGAFDSFDRLLDVLQFDLLLVCADLDVDNGSFACGSY